MYDVKTLSRNVPIHINIYIVLWIPHLHFVVKNILLYFGLHLSITISKRGSSDRQNGRREIDQVSS